MCISTGEPDWVGAAALCSGILKGRRDRGPWMCNGWKLKNWKFFTNEMRISHSNILHSKNKNSKYTVLATTPFVFSQTIPGGYSLGQGVRILSLCFSVCPYLLILLQFCQSRGGIISDLCRSQSLGTSHSIILCLGLNNSSTVREH